MTRNVSAKSLKIGFRCANSDFALKIPGCLESEI